MAISKPYDAVRGHGELREHLGRHELRILASEIALGDPTGPAAASSDMDRYALFRRLGYQFLQWRPANAMDVVGDYVFE